MLVVRRVVYDVVQRIVHHVVGVEHREARVEVGGDGRGADPGMPSARAAASCAASPRTGVHRHAHVAESIFMAPSGLSMQKEHRLCRSAWNYATYKYEFIVGSA